MVQRRSGFRRSIGSPVEDRDLAAHLENAGGFFQYGSTVVEFMPDICSEEEIATALRETCADSFRVDKLHVEYRGFIQLLFQKREHLVLGVYRVDLALESNSVSQWQREVASSGTHIGDRLTGMHIHRHEHIRRRKQIGRAATTRSLPWSPTASANGNEK